MTNQEHPMDQCVFTWVKVTHGGPDSPNRNLGVCGISRQTHTPRKGSNSSPDHPFTEALTTGCELPHGPVSEYPYATVQAGVEMAKLGVTECDVDGCIEPQWSVRSTMYCKYHGPRARSERVASDALRTGAEAVIAELRHHANSTKLGTRVTTHRDMTKWADELAALLTGEGETDGG